MLKKLGHHFILDLLFGIPTRNLAPTELGPVVLFQKLSLEGSIGILAFQSGQTSTLVASAALAFVKSCSGCSYLPCQVCICQILAKTLMLENCILIIALLVL